MTKKHTYYRESRWLYLAYVLILVFFQWHDDARLLFPIALICLLPIIILNEQKPKKCIKG